MNKRDSKSPGPEWSTRDEAAKKSFGVSTAQFDKTYRDIAPDAIKTVNGRVWVHARTIWNAIVKRTKDEAEAKAKLLDDPMLASGGDSPATERYRAAKASIAELDLAEREGSIIRKAVISEVLMPLAGIMRDTGDRLARQFGNPALEVFNEGFEDMKAGIRKASE